MVEVDEMAGPVDLTDNLAELTAAFTIEELKRQN